MLRITNRSGLMIRKLKQKSSRNLVKHFKMELLPKPVNDFEMLITLI